MRQKCDGPSRSFLYGCSSSLGKADVIQHDEYRAYPRQGRHTGRGRCLISNQSRIVAYQTYLAQTSSKYDNFVYLPHLFEEIINAWSFDHIHIMPVILNLDRHNVVRLRY